MSSASRKLQDFLEDCLLPIKNKICSLIHLTNVYGTPALCMTLKVMEDEPPLGSPWLWDWRVVGGSAGTCGSGQIGRQVGEEAACDVLLGCL